MHGGGWGAREPNMRGDAARLRVGRQHGGEGREHLMHERVDGHKRGPAGRGHRGRRLAQLACAPRAARRARCAAFLCHGRAARRSAVCGPSSGASTANACGFVSQGQGPRRLRRTLGVDDEDLGGGDADGEVADLVGVSVAKARVERVVLRREQGADVLPPATMSPQLHANRS